MTQMEMSTRSRFYFICILPKNWVGHLNTIFARGWGAEGGGNLNKKVIKSSKPEIYAGGDVEASN